MEHETHARSRSRHGQNISRPHARDAVDPGVRVSDADDDVGVAEARRRFGGIDIPATLAGMLAAVGMAVVLGGLLNSAGAFGSQLGLKDATTISRRT